MQTADFAAPELYAHATGRKHVERTVEQDLWALAVLIFHLLMEGVHPFSGKYNGKEEPPMVAQSVIKGTATRPQGPVSRNGNRFNTQHRYGPHLGDRCPWCLRMTAGYRDSFPPRKKTYKRTQDGDHIKYGHTIGIASALTQNASCITGSETIS